MNKPKIVINITAKVEWPQPPKDSIEEHMRVMANVITAEAGKKLETAVALLVAELLDAQTNLTWPKE